MTPSEKIRLTREAVKNKIGKYPEKAIVSKKVFDIILKETYKGNIALARADGFEIN